MGTAPRQVDERGQIASRARSHSGVDAPVSSQKHAKNAHEDSPAQAS